MTMTRNSTLAEMKRNAVVALVVLAVTLLGTWIVTVLK
jgi:hypothetical protein